MKTIVFIHSGWLFYIYIYDCLNWPFTVSNLQGVVFWGFGLYLPAFVFMDGGNQLCDGDDSEDWLRELLLYNRQAPNHPCTFLHELHGIQTLINTACVHQDMEVYQTLWWLMHVFLDQMEMWIYDVSSKFMRCMWG